MEPSLKQFGWNETTQAAWLALNMPQLVPARVIADFGSMLKVAAPSEWKAEISGKLMHDARHTDLPKVGDWIGLHTFEDGHAYIETVLPRKSELSRKAAGAKVERQVMCANVDVAFVVQALDDDFSIKRLQRYLFQLQQGNIKPILVFNKADKVIDLETYIEQVKTLNVDYIVTSAKTGEGVQAMLDHLQPGETAVLLGSSGVGKSTLTNQLLGRSAQATQEVRERDGKGRHTTIHRELFMLEGGGLLVDMPGIRELQLWGTEDDLEETFDDVTELAMQCKYTTCSHGSEPGCAIHRALANGKLDKAHYENYLKMKRELDYLKTKTSPEAMRIKKRQGIKIMKQHYKDMKTSVKYKKN